MKIINNKQSLTNAKNHFGMWLAQAGCGILAPQNHSDFVYFDGSEYFVTFNV